MLHAAYFTHLHALHTRTSGAVMWLSSMALSQELAGDTVIFRIRPLALNASEKVTSPSCERRMAPSLLISNRCPVVIKRVILRRSDPFWSNACENVAFEN